MSRAFHRATTIARNFGTRHPNLAVRLAEIDRNLASIDRDMTELCRPDRVSTLQSNTRPTYSGVRLTTRTTSQMGAELDHYITTLNREIAEGRQVMSRINGLRDTVEGTIRDPHGAIGNLERQVATHVSELEARLVAAQTRAEAMKVSVFRMRNSGGWPIQRIQEWGSEILRTYSGRISQQQAVHTAERVAAEATIEIAGRRLVARVVVGAVASLTIVFEIVAAVEIFSAVLDVLDLDSECRHAYERAINQHLRHIDDTLSHERYTREVASTNDGAVWSRLEIIVARNGSGEWQSQTTDLGITNNHDIEDSPTGPHGGQILYLPINEAAIAADTDATARERALEDNRPPVPPIIDRPGGVPQKQMSENKLEIQSEPIQDMIIRLEKAEAPNIVITQKETVADMTFSLEEAEAPDMEITRDEVAQVDRAKNNTQQSDPAYLFRYDPSLGYDVPVWDNLKGWVMDSSYSNESSVRNAGDFMREAEMDNFREDSEHAPDLIITPEETDTRNIVNTHEETDNPNRVITQQEPGSPDISITSEEVEAHDMVITSEEAPDMIITQEEANTTDIVKAVGEIEEAAAMSTIEELIPTQNSVSAHNFQSESIRHIELEPDNNLVCDSSNAVSTDGTEVDDSAHDLMQRSFTSPNEMNLQCSESINLKDPCENDVSDHSSNTLTHNMDNLQKQEENEIMNLPDPEILPQD